MPSFKRNAKTKYLVIGISCIMYKLWVYKIKVSVKFLFKKVPKCSFRSDHLDFFFFFKCMSASVRREKAEEEKSFKTKN